MADNTEYYDHILDLYHSLSNEDLQILLHCMRERVTIFNPNTGSCDMLESVSKNGSFLQINIESEEDL